MALHERLELGRERQHATAVVLRPLRRQTDHAGRTVHVGPSEPEHLAFPPAAEIGEVQHVAHVVREPLAERRVLGGLEKVAAGLGLFEPT